MMDITRIYDFVPILLAVEMVQWEFCAGWMGCFPSNSVGSHFIPALLFQVIQFHSIPSLEFIATAFNDVANS
jgi:hypothetical protein